MNSKKILKDCIEFQSEVNLYTKKSAKDICTGKAAKNPTLKLYKYPKKVEEFKKLMISKRIEPSKPINTPAQIGFETRFKSNLCSALEKNIPNTKCKSHDAIMTQYMIESAKTGDNNNKKWWDKASKILGDERFVMNNK